MEKKVFITFADRKMKPTLQRIKSEALQSRFFDEINTYDERTFDSAYWKRYKKWYMEHPRGFGYWYWKPYLILRELNKMSDDDILIYLDAGCVINSGGG